MGRTVSYAIFSVMVVGALAYMVHDNIRYSAASSWQSTEGRITESVVNSGGGVRAGSSYSPQVSYTYAVRGRNFSGYNIWLTAGLAFSTAEEADTFLSPYRPGSRVRIFYDPADPADLALIVERGGDPMVIFIIAGIWGLIVTYHYPRRGDTSNERASLQSGQPPAAGNAPDLAQTRMPWGRVFGQMAISFLIVCAGFVVYVMMTGPG